MNENERGGNIKKKRNKERERRKKEGEKTE